ncbi:MAG: hypothetical protein HC915_10370 [Anaerolineae bacterium]|nr:hypothetical protein [Anaerolineae bacterium]
MRCLLLALMLAVFACLPAPALAQEEAFTLEGILVNGTDGDDTITANASINGGEGTSFGQVIVAAEVMVYADPVQDIGNSGGISFFLAEA